MKFKESTAKFKTNMKESKRIVASIGNPVKMLKMFTKDLYKNPIQTAIQEYINNAKDAHLMAKKDTSTIEITFPTVANQNVIIKDYGLGLSPKEIEEVFASITSSNKDESDLFNGGFGIGSKSWFAVHPHFYVISTYNKVKTYYEVSFSDNIYIDVQGEEETNEVNGVEVILPLANSNQIEEASLAIKRAIRFWSNRPKLINGVLANLPVLFEDKDFRLIAIEGKSQLHVTLGETQYSINDFEKLKNCFKQNFPSCSIELKFKVGEAKLIKSLEVGPDREHFVLEMLPFIDDKMNKALKKMPIIFTDLIENETEYHKIQALVDNRFYQKDVYKVSLDGLSLIFRKNNEAPLLSQFGTSLYNSSSSCNHRPFLSESTLFLTHEENSTIKKNYYRIASQIFNSIQDKKGSKPKFIHFINTSSTSKENLDVLRKKAKVKELSDFKFDLPKTIDDKVKEKNPRLCITSSGTLSKSTGNLIIKKSSFVHLKEVNKNSVFISTKDYPNGTTSTNKLISNLKKIKQEFYLVSANQMVIVNHFKLKTLDLKKLEKELEVIKNEEELKVKEKREAREKKLIEEINNPKTYAIMKYHKLINEVNYGYVHDVIDNVIILNEVLDNKKIDKTIIELNEINIQKIISSGNRYLKKFKTFEKMYKHFNQETELLDIVLKIQDNYPVFYDLYLKTKPVWSNDVKEYLILANHIKENL